MIAGLSGQEIMESEKCGVCANILGRYNPIIDNNIHT